MVPDHIPLMIKLALAFKKAAPFRDRSLFNAWVGGVRKGAEGGGGGGAKQGEI